MLGCPSPMNLPATLAIVGSGPSTLYLLQHVFAHLEVLRPLFDKVMIFEKAAMMGAGMPYNPAMTDGVNMSNISSEELPPLPETLAAWLRTQSPWVLESLGITPGKISEEAVYSRIALGKYFTAQHQLLVSWIAEAGIEVEEHAACEIVDMRDDAATGSVSLYAASGEVFEASRVVIATGHQWPAKDVPECGYYASPWPISKLLPAGDAGHDFTVGTLGASLSAFDVISSLAHRHGRFIRLAGGRMTYEPAPGTEKFKVVMHSAQGLLPHLQFDQVNPRRDIHRHVSHEAMMKLRDARGFLRLEHYFDQVCRPVLRQALAQDGIHDVGRKLEQPSFGLLDFVEAMGDKHDYANAFEGMRKEMVEAEHSVRQHVPIHWKEAVDDLMYTLNYYAELMPAEDHLTLQGKVMPFLMNVIAAMPLPSANSILALHDAGKLELVAGRVVRVSKLKSQRHTVVTVEQEDGGELKCVYPMFVDCSGQKPVSLKEYPFPSLVRSRRVRRARSPFLHARDRAQTPPEKKPLVEKRHGRWCYETGGIDIDSAYRIIGADDRPNPRIHDIAFPHTSGHRPYSYGLQACSDTGAMVVQAWVDEVRGNGS